ncbi:MAG: sigma-70 family RNA polymerase sigma factor [Synergistaceae bacterium]|nr:sigma-70 family RNA polymerase sigma factor [Synergistaceae bacterium]
MADRRGDGLTKGGGEELNLNRDRSNREIAGLIRQFAPLVSMTARRFEGRGAEREDLAQEGYLALIEIARRSAKRRLAYRLSSGIPWRVRAAASRMRRPEAERPLASEEDAPESPELSIMDERTVRDFEELEIFDAMERLLCETDLAIAKASARGLTQSEIAESMGVSQQAIARRLAGIRSKLREIL